MVDWGRVDYREARARQLAVVAERQRGLGSDQLIFVEHPHVITVGRSQAAASNVLAAGDVEVIEVERGGDVTYHGPGQIICYPIVALGEAERDLHAFLRRLEQAMIDTVARWGISANREPGRTGVWTGGRKLASIGIACRKWVTFHGLALNVTTDLGYFSRINPCGFSASVMTSMAAELPDAPPSLAEVKHQLASDLARFLRRSLA
jgi:lipoyl(octanoyl) transferase